MLSRRLMFLMLLLLQTSEALLGINSLRSFCSSVFSSLSGSGSGDEISSPRKNAVYGSYQSYDDAFDEHSFEVIADAEINLAIDQHVASIIKNEFAVVTDDEAAAAEREIQNQLDTWSYPLAIILEYYRLAACCEYDVSESKVCFRCKTKCYQIQQSTSYSDCRVNFLDQLCALQKEIIKHLSVTGFEACSSRVKTSLFYEQELLELFREAIDTIKNLYAYKAAFYVTKYPVTKEDRIKYFIVRQNYHPRAVAKIAGWLFCGNQSMAENFYNQHVMGTVGSLKCIIIDLACQFDSSFDRQDFSKILMARHAEQNFKKWHGSDFFINECKQLAYEWVLQRRGLRIEK